MTDSLSGALGAFQICKVVRVIRLCEGHSLRRTNVHTCLLRGVWTQICDLLILIVDDDPAIRELLSELLQDEGYPVATAANGAEALTYLHHHRNQPSLVLLDLNMPIMSGWEFRTRQIEDPAISSIPVVEISAKPAGERDAAALGVTEYLAKPIDFNALLRTVQRYYTQP